jgi:hypothetical protein
VLLVIFFPNQQVGSMEIIIEDGVLTFHFLEDNIDTQY